MTSPERRWAWDAYVQHRHYTKNYFLTEVFRELDIPWMVGFYVEHKNVFGMTVRASVDNIFNGRHTLNRVVYTGYRDRAPVSFFDKRTSLSARSSTCRSKAPSSVGSALLGLRHGARSAMPKIDLDAIDQTNRTGYPPPFNEPVQGRWQRKVAEAAGLTDLGVDHVVLESRRLVEPAPLARGEDELLVMIRTCNAGRGRGRDRASARRLRRLAEGRHQRPSSYQRERRGLRLHRASAAGRTPAAAIRTST